VAVLLIFIGFNGGKLEAAVFAFAIPLDDGLSLAEVHNLMLVVVGDLIDATAAVTTLNGGRLTLPGH
jgi:hypothetical protein